MPPHTSRQHIRPATVTDPFTQTTTFGYDAVGNVTSIAYPNTLTETYTYNDRYFTTNVAVSNGTSYAYDYDDVGNRTQIEHWDGSQLQGKVEWLYDDAYRLTDEDHYAADGVTVNDAYHWDYDLTGNRTDQSHINITNGITNSTYEYNNVDELFRETTGGLVTDYVYDERGNLKTITQGTDVTTFTYDARNNLRSVALPNTPVTQYRYDADNRRIQVDNTDYLWDEGSRYGDVVMESSGSTINASYTLANNQLISQNRNSADSYYLHDALGSTRGLADGTGAITDSYTYTAFGEIYSSSGATANSYLFAGQMYDANTDLYQMRARYYDPSVGRFTSFMSTSHLTDTMMPLNSSWRTCHLIKKDSTSTLLARTTSF